MGFKYYLATERKGKGPQIQLNKGPLGHLPLRSTIYLGEATVCVCRYTRCGVMVPEGSNFTSEGAEFPREAGQQTKSKYGIPNRPSEFFKALRAQALAPIETPH